MKKILLMCATVVLATTLMGCSSWNKQDTGTLAGGVVGATAGGLLTGGSAVGVGVGAVGGAVIGRKMSE